MDEICNAIVEVWSNGGLKGQITRLNLLKRAICFHANAELHRARITAIEERLTKKNYGADNDVAAFQGWIRHFGHQRRSFIHLPELRYEGDGGAVVAQGGDDTKKRSLNLGQPQDSMPLGTAPLSSGADAGASKTPVKDMKATATQAPAEQLQEQRANRAVITGCVIMASLIFSLDSTIANVALPYMRGTMSASQDEINWVLTSYLVATAIMTAPVGFLAARFGRTRLFVLSIIGFSFMSVLCGAAQSLNQIVLFRILQGIAGAPLVPLSQAVLFDIYPIERRGFAMSLWVTGVNLGPILGPTLGGWITQNYSWRWVFYINVPLGILTAAGVIFSLKETRNNNAGRLDWIGFGALSLAVGAFQTVLDRGETLDWFASPEIITETVLAGIGFYIFVVQSALAPNPFLSPRLFTNVNFVVGVTIYSTIALLLYATMALIAPYLEALMNYPVSTAGLVMAPRGFGTMLGAVVAGRLVRQMDVRSLVALGICCNAYTLYRMTLWTPDISAWDVVSTGVVQGVGISFITIPLSISTFSTLPLSMRIEAASVYSLLRNIASSIGISITGALLVSNTQINHALIAGLITPFERSIQTGAASRFWDPNLLGGAVALNNEITRQANIIAYIDDFKLLLVLTLLVAPLTLMIQTRPAQR